MPFTPSHAVVALPFVRTSLVPAAIAVGAMTPDLALFTRGIPLGYSRTHDLLWLPLTMVLALALLLLWRCVLRPSVRELAPDVIARRIPGEWDAGPAAGWRETLSPRLLPMLLLVASLAVGVLSHIVWDLFTHEGRAGVAIFPILDAEWGALPGYKWLQHGSSALGAGILAAWMLMWTVRRPVAPLTRRVLSPVVRVTWWLSLPLVLVIAWVLGLFAYGPITVSWTPAHLAYRVLPLAVTVWAMITVVLAVIVVWRRADSSKRTKTA